MILVVIWNEILIILIYTELLKEYRHLPIFHKIEFKTANDPLQILFARYCYDFFIGLEVFSDKFWFSESSN